VRLTVQDGRVDVQLRSPDPAVSGQLRAQGSDVHDVLAAHGLDLGAFDVSTQSDQQPGQQPGSARTSERAAGRRTDVPETPPTTRARRARAPGCERQTMTTPVTNAATTTAPSSTSSATGFDKDMS